MTDKLNRVQQQEVEQRFAKLLRIAGGEANVVIPHISCAQIFSMPIGAAYKEGMLLVPTFAIKATEPTPENVQDEKLSIDRALYDEMNRRIRSAVVNSRSSLTRLLLTRGYRKIILQILPQFGQTQSQHKNKILSEEFAVLNKRLAILEARKAMEREKQILREAREKEKQLVREAKEKEKQKWREARERVIPAPPIIDELVAGLQHSKARREFIAVMRKTHQDPG